MMVLRGSTSYLRIICLLRGKEFNENATKCQEYLRYSDTVKNIVA